MSTTVLLAIPMFVMAGGLIEKGEIGNKLVDLIEVFIGRMRGGLGSVAVVACAVFGSVTGSATATLSCIGSVVFPRLEKAGYPLGHSAALLGSSCVLGMLIPPSTIMILYAWVGGQSVLACFLSSVLPGIFLTFLLCLVNWHLVKKIPTVKVEDRISFTEFRKKATDRTWKAVPALVLPFLVLGTIYGGVLTTTEAAAASVLYAIPVGFFVYKGLTRKNFFNIIVQTAVTTGVVMVMVFFIMILSRLYIMQNLPDMIIKYLTAVSENKYVILAMINVFMIIIGMLMDDVSGTLLCTPILLPIIMKIGVHPVHFAAILGVNLGLGNVTPPCAPLLYLAGRLNGAKMIDMLKPMMYTIVFGWIPALIVTTYVPSLSLYLPKLILGVE
jgi:C4-dicarboxylate transporter DctM subunit